MIIIVTYVKTKGHSTDYCKYNSLTKETTKSNNYKNNYSFHSFNIIE